VHGKDASDLFYESSKHTSLPVISHPIPQNSTNPELDERTGEQVARQGRDLRRLIPALDPQAPPSMRTIVGSRCGFRNRCFGVT
jgi:hypothetical protein